MFNRVVLSIILLFTIILSSFRTENMEDKSSKFLSVQLKKIESLISQRDRYDPKISSSDVAWHLDHMIKVINNVYDTVKHSNPKDYKSDINLGRTLIFTIGKIPRGRAKSPTSVLPPENIITEALHRQLEMAKQNAAAFDSLDIDQYFKHFGFGMLNKEKTKRFLEIHTNHHLSIIEDILKD